MPSSIANSRIDQWLLRRIYDAVGKPQIGLRLRNGANLSPENAPSAAHIIIEDRQTLARLILDPEIGFGEGYSKGRITVEGDLVAALEAASRSMSQARRRTWYGQLVSRFMRYAQR